MRAGARKHPAHAPRADAAVTRWPRASRMRMRTSPGAGSGTGLSPGARTFVVRIQAIADRTNYNNHFINNQYYHTIHYIKQIT